MSDAVVGRAAANKLKAVGARIADLRHQARLTQDELANIIGVARATLATIETGRNRAGAETTLAIADYFRVSMDWLLCREMLSKAAIPPALVGDAQVSAPERELLDTFRSTDRQGRTMMLRFAKALRGEAAVEREAAA
jgi:transcriptional regulator with XRE-family HTH domain